MCPTGNTIESLPESTDQNYPTTYDTDVPQCSYQPSSDYYNYSFYNDLMDNDDRHFEPDNSHCSGALDNLLETSREGLKDMSLFGWTVNNQMLFLNV